VIKNYIATEFLYDYLKDKKSVGVIDEDRERALQYVAEPIFLPHVLRYNASLPSKFMPAPGYSAYIAPEKYAQIAGIVGLGGKTEGARRERLFARVDELLAEVDEPRTLADCGVERREFEEALPELAKAAFADPSIRTNPRIPMIREVIELLEAGYSKTT
jgi:acetaldehyde dehydrogenase/alcohol dehydrogenase